jgi:hypothetical protein
MTQFLFMHPSFKRIVEFISETVFSSYIKYYRHNELKKELNDFIDYYYTHNNVDDNNREIIDLSELENNIKNLLNFYSKNCATKCIESSKPYFISKIDILIDNLLEKTESVKVISTTKQITLFKSMEKLKQWIGINLNERIFFDELKMRRFNNNKKKNNEQQQPDTGMNEEELTCDKSILNLTQIMPSDLFNHIKVFIN